MNKSIIKITLMVFSLVLMLSFSASAQKTDCTKTTDTEIADAVTAKIKAKYEAQMSHITVKVVDKVVTIEGWVTTKSIKKDIEKIAKKTVCVKKVTNNLGIGAGGGCPAGSKPCNGGCIPLTEDCPAKGKGI